MGRNVIEIVIRASDEASGAIRKTVRTLSSEFDALGRTVLKVGAGAALGGITALGTGLGVAISEAMEAEVNLAKLDAVLKATGRAAGLTRDQITAMADSLSQVTRFSGDAILSGQTMLLTFTNIGKDTFPRATEAMLDMAEMFGGVEQASVMLGKALNDPVEGVSALRRVGVQLSEEQERTINQLVEMGDVAGAQAVILDELEREFGGVARAAGDTLSGKITILKNRLLDMAEGIGMKLLPVLGQLLERYLMPGVDRFAGFIAVVERAAWYITRFGSDSVVAGAMLQSFFGKGLGSAIQTGLVAIERIANAFRSFVQETLLPFISSHSKEFTAALGAIGAVLAGAAIVSGIAAIGGALAGLIALLTGPAGLLLAIGVLAAAWAGNWGGIRSVITEDVWPVIEPIFTTLRDWLSETLPAAIEVLKGAFSGLKEAFETGGLAAVGRLILDSLEAGLSDLATWVHEAIVIPIGTALRDTDWSAVPGRLGELLERFLSLTGRGAASIGEWLWEHLIQPLGDYLGSIDWSNVGNRLLDLLVRFIGWEFSTYVSIGVWLWEHLIQPLGDYLGAVDWSNVGNRLLDLLGQLFGAAGAGLQSIGTWAYDTLIQPVIDILSNGDTYARLFEAALTAGSAIFNAILAALKDLPRHVIDFINQAIPNEINLGTFQQTIDAGILGKRTITVDFGAIDLPDNPIPHLATGGVVTRPTIALLGERGAEAVVPLSRWNEGRHSVVITGPVYIQGVQDPAGLLDALEREAGRRNMRLLTGRG